MNEYEDRLSMLEAQVQKLQDCEDIRQLLASYGPLADSADNAERRGRVGALFASEGVYDLGEDWRATGPEQIGELLNNPEHLDLVANGSAHVMGMPHIVLAGDTASAVSYSRVYRHLNGEFTVWRVAANWWQCARVDGKWKVMLRVNRLLNGAEAAREILRNTGAAEPPPV